jgi:MFS family permease
MAGIAALTLGYVLSQFYRSFLAVLSPTLIEELGATKTDLSVASGAWFIAFASMQFAVGVALDRYGPRWTTAIMLAIGGGGGALLFAVATTPAMVVAAMVLIGIGCSPVLMAAVYIFAHSYSPARMAVLTSSLVGIGSAGNVIGASPLAAAAEAFGWRGVLVALAGITVLTALAVLVVVRNPVVERTQGGGGFGGYLELLKLKVLWPIIPLTAINYAPPVGIRGLWAGPYLADVYGATTIVIGQVTLVMALAMVAGNFIYGPLDQIFRTRKWVAVVGNCFGIAALFWLAFHPGGGIYADTALFAIIGLCGASYGLLIAHARAFVPAHLTGRGVTLMNFFSIGGVGTMQFASGAVVSRGTDPALATAGYQSLFLFYAVLLTGAVAIYLAARDAKPVKS